MKRLLSLILILVASGCIKKDDLTLPVTVKFKIGILTDDLSTNEYLNFLEEAKKHSITIHSIRIVKKITKKENRIFFINIV